MQPRLSSSIAAFATAFLLCAAGCDDEPVGDAGADAALPDAGGTRDAGRADAGEMLDAGPGDAGPQDAGLDDGGVDACTGPEVCNGADDDCDGDADEGFDLDNDTANCGLCGMACDAGDVCRFGLCAEDVPQPVSIAAGAAHTCVRMSDGDVRCWGDNALGQLGQGDLEPHTGIVTVMTLSNIQAVDAGANHSCVVTRSDVAVCWGDDAMGQIGNRAPVGAPRPATIPAGVSGGIVGVETIALGHATSCAGTPFGSLFCWGANGSGQIGDGTTDQQDSAVPVMRDDGLFDGIDTGEAHSCALLRVTGEPAAVRCWGDNSDGAYGSGAFTASNTPAVTSFPGATQVQTGAGVTCVLTGEGDVHCAGRNRRGALGDGVASHADFDTVDRSATPVTVAGLSDAVEVELSHEHACARLADGTLQCWGSNAHGQLGDGATHDACQDMPSADCAFSPVAVPGLSDAIDVATGAEHTCALLRDGRVFCWGRNAEGQLGVEGADRSTPVEVSL
ncbi:MAG: RCC1 domain-containing protein [Sandaracinaceae bacterium]